MQITRFYVELNRHDTTVAGTLGDVEWVDSTSCLITTDDFDGMVARLEEAEDEGLVLSWEEVMEGDGR